MSEEDSVDPSLESESSTLRSPEEFRSRARSQAEVLEVDELAQMAQRAESEYGNAVQNQNAREQETRDLLERLENNAGMENESTNEFLASAQKTGLVDIDSRWGFEDSEYLHEGGELIEFAEEGQDLMGYFEQQSGEIDRLSEQVAQFTGLMSQAREKEEEQISEIETELNEAEEEKRTRIDEAEQERQEEIEDLNDQVANMAASDVEGSGYEDPGDLWQDEWSDISSEFESKKSRAEESYERMVEQLESEKQRVREDAKQQRSMLKDQKQELVEERVPRLDELERVHSEFSNDVIRHVDEQVGDLQELFTTLSSLEKMRTLYDQYAVSENFEGPPEVRQGQEQISEDITLAANSIAYRALRRIDRMEDAIDDYDRAVGRITDQLNDQEERIGTREDDIFSQYDHLVPGDAELEGEYGVDALRERVKDHVESATSQNYDAIDEFQRKIERMAEGV